MEGSSLSLPLIFPSLVTWHGPGQLVGYPVLDLRQFHKSILWYVEALQQVIIETLAQMGVQGGLTGDVGVWIEGQRKIAALGISASRWITMHGTVFFFLGLRHRWSSDRTFQKKGLLSMFAMTSNPMMPSSPVAWWTKKLPL